MEGRPPPLPATLRVAALVEGGGGGAVAALSTAAPRPAGRPQVPHRAWGHQGNGVPGGCPAPAEERCR